MNRLVLLVTALAGCSAPAPPAAPLAPAGPAPLAAPAADAGPLPAADAGAGLGVLSTTGDIDGVPGDEQISFAADGTLRAGSLEIHVEPPESSDYFWHKQSVLQVVLLDAGTGQVAIHLGVPTGDGEDPPNINRVFLVRGGRLVEVFDRIVGVYTPGKILFPGDGTLRFVEQGWEACERAKHPPTPVTRQEVVFRLDRAGRTMVEWRRIDTAEQQDCSQLSACPFVYALREGGAVRVGEILRDLRGARAYSLQSLPLPRGTTRVRLAEEKPEVTYLDEIVLEVGGVELRPLACRGEPVPAYCAADRVPFVMRRGDTLDLEFDAPAGGDHTLFARGYYVPTD
ncbi:MAG TPA: hypothetical protein VFU21_09040 [Kofleriaceae bacterium]|nr:hypothetical protein [Kofleriaceae bacterium]